MPKSLGIRVFAVLGSPTLCVMCAPLRSGELTLLPCENGRGNIPTGGRHLLLFVATVETENLPVSFFLLMVRQETLTRAYEGH